MIHNQTHNDHRGNPAFTMIEMMVVLFLIGIALAIVMPRLAHKAPKSEWKNVQDDLNAILSLARQHALAEHRTCRIVFDAREQGSDIITLEQEVINQDDGQKVQFEPINSPLFTTPYRLHESIKITAAYIERKRLIDQPPGKIYCYIVPDGLVQDVRLFFVRNLRGIKDKATFFTRPFLGTMQYQPDHIKPDKELVL